MCTSHVGWENVPISVPPAELTCTCTPSVYPVYVCLKTWDFLWSYCPDRKCPEAPCFFLFLSFQWFEPSQFGTWWSLLSCSMNLAGSLGPLCVTVLLHHYDWRTVLTMSGTLCAAFALVCLVFVRNDPKDVGLPSVAQSAKKDATAGKSSLAPPQMV